MNTNRIIGALALGLGLAIGAQAQTGPGTQIYITGSTAFRTQVFAALGDLGLVNATGAANNANQFTFDGPISDNTPGHDNLNLDGTGGDTVTVYSSWNGAIEGIEALIDNTAANFLDITGSTFSHDGADLAFSVIAQTSAFQGEGHTQVNFTPTKTGVTLSEIQLSADASLPEGTGIAVQPYAFFVDGRAQTISNITADQFFDLYGPGTLNLSFFTGNAADAATQVYAVGGYNLQGTRSTAVTDFGGSFLNNLSQYALSANGTTTPGLASTDTASPPSTGNQWVAVGNNGYFSTGNTAKAIHDASVNGAPPAIAYIDFANAANLKGTLTNSEGPINWQGQVPWVGGTFPNAGGWNTNAVINGAYDFWTYVRLYLSPNDPVGTDPFATQFGQALISAIQYEIIHTPTAFGTDANNQPTALLESQMNVYRNGDGGDVILNP
jgi:hypothetical protein